MIVTLTKNQTATGAGSVINLQGAGANRCLQAVLTGTGATATVSVNGSNDGVNFSLLYTFTLSAAGNAINQIVSSCQYMQVNVSALAAGASVTVTSVQ